MMTNVYGFSANLTVFRKAGGDSFVVSGIAENGSRWTRILSRRAAQMLWFYLSRNLFPYKMLTAAVGTAPMREAGLPSVTSHLILDRLDDNNFELTGWSGGRMWILRFREVEARHLWSSLDGVLHPLGYPPAMGLREAAPTETTLE
jgi:hypothetical protein